MTSLAAGRAFASCTTTLLAGRCDVRILRRLDRSLTAGLCAACCDARKLKR